jgi:hypothetical protein
MRNKTIGLLTMFAITAVVAMACADNPLAEGRDTVDRFSTNPSFANVKVSDSTRVTAIAVNVHGEPTGDAVTATACDNKVTIANDPTRTSFEPPERFVVRGVTAGASCITVSAAGKQATVTINVVP